MTTSLCPVRVAAYLGLALCAYPVHAQTIPPVTGVIESYWMTTPVSQGLIQPLTWMELKGRISDRLSATCSAYDFGSICGFDEAYVRYEQGPYAIRGGRFRTSFGLSDWTELYYNGINFRPLVRELSLVNQVHLDRDDSGLEATANFGPLQLQAAAVDSQLLRPQVSPNNLDHLAFTAQYGLGPVIVMLEKYSSRDWREQVNGVSIRFTLPHWIIKSEYFEGLGPNRCSGGYTDVTYRLPTKTRTELVGRIEHVVAANSDAPTSLTTLGIRQIIGPNLVVNLNYGWGRELNYSGYATYMGLGGWSLQAMTQVRF